MAAPKPDGLLPVPLLRQQNVCSCGLASVNMVFHFYGLNLPEREIEKNHLVRREFLQHHGFGPGRLGRIALSYGYKAVLIEPDPAEVGKTFVAEGGRWLRRSPSKADIEACLARGIPPVVCIPDKSKAFENCSHRGSHWVTVIGHAGGDLAIHDPAPWRKAVRCKPGYWEDWNCSLLAVAKSTELLGFLRN